jgi:hypothetical protein
MWWSWSWCREVQRWPVRPTKVHPPPIQLAEVAEELYEQVALVLADVEEAVDEDVVGDVAESNHDSFVPEVFHTSWHAPR